MVAPEGATRSATRTLSPTPEAGDVVLDRGRHLHRQRLDAQLVERLAEHAALDDARRLADQLQADRRLDRLVEPHLVQVEVGDPAANGVLLELLDDRRVRRLLALDDDVEDRVQAGLRR